MNTSLTINERLTEFIKTVNKNTNSFAKSIGKTYTAIESICKGKTKPGYELLESIFLNYPQLSRDWLLMGEGEMIRSDHTQPDNDYLLEHLKALEENFKLLTAQLATKDKQIDGLQRTADSLQRYVDTLLGSTPGNEKAEKKAKSFPKPATETGRIVEMYPAEQSEKKKSA